MSQVIPAVIWLVVNVVMLFAASSLGRRLFPQDGLPMILLHTIVLCWACVVGAATALGLLGLLSAYALLALVGAISLLVLGFLSASQCDHFIPSSRVESPNSSPAGSSTQDSGSSEAQGTGNWYAIAWTILVAFGIGRVFTAGLFRFPTDWDSLMYHVPLIDHWLQAGTLFVPACPRWYFPGNNELMGLWFVAPFSGDFLIGLNNLPSVVLLAASAFALANTLGVSRPLCHWTGLAVVTVFPVMRQLTDAENDVAVVALFLACLCYSFCYLRSNRFAHLAFASVTLGILAGVKYYAAGYAGIAFTTSLVVTLACRGPRAAITMVIAGLVGGILFGGYWYVRNTLVAGSPFYPQGITAGPSLFTHLRPKVWSSSLLSSSQPEVWPLALKAVWNKGGLVQFASVLTLPLSLAGLVATGIHLRVHHAMATIGILRLALAAIIVETGLLLAVIPNVVETRAGTMNSLNDGYLPVRFGLCFLSVSVVGFVVMIQVVTRWILQRTIRPDATIRQGKSMPIVTEIDLGIKHSLLLRSSIYGLSIGVIIIQVVWWSTSKYPGSSIDRADLIDSFLISINLLLTGILAVIFTNSMPQVKRFVPGFLILGIVAIVCLIGFLEQQWHKDYASNYDRYSGGSLFSELEESDPVTTRICACEYRYYPFFGSKRQFHICRPIWAPSYAWFCDYIHEHDVNLVIVPDKDVFPGHYAPIKQWLDEHPLVFKEIRENSPPLVLFSKRVYLFRVNLLKLAEEIDLAADGK